MIRRILGITLALLAHGVILLFGGLLFLRSGEAGTERRAIAEVDLVEPHKPPDPKPEEQKTETPPEADPREVLQEASAMPDLHELAALDAPAAAPALDAMSLSALADALSATEGVSSAGFYANSVSLSSGGRIGGTGSTVESAALDQIFSLADLDQKPRPIYQAAPSYPYDLRRRKVEGTVQMLFVVNEEGRVVDPSVEKATHPEFEKAALDAVRQWKFEPAVRAGKKVPCRMRVPLRFAVS